MKIKNLDELKAGKLFAIVKDAADDYQEVVNLYNDLLKRCDEMQMLPTSYFEQLSRSAHCPIKELREYIVAGMKERLARLKSRADYSEAELLNRIINIDEAKCPTNPQE